MVASEVGIMTQGTLKFTELGRTLGNNSMHFFNASSLKLKERNTAMVIGSLSGIPSRRV